MSTKPSTGRVRSAYEFIKAHRDQYSVQMMCRVLEVAQSGYYDWLKQPVSNHAQQDARLLRLIRASFTAGQSGTQITDFVVHVRRVCDGLRHFLS